MRQQAYLERITRGIIGRRAARLIRDELASHLASCQEDLIAEGWSPDQAASEAQRRLGAPPTQAVVWRRYYYASWLNGETLIGSMVGLIVGSEPWWMAGGGSQITWQADVIEAGALILTLVALIGMGIQWRRRAWTATRFAAWSVARAFWIMALGVSSVIGLGHPLPPARVMDWYNWSYVGHLTVAGGLLTGVVMIVMWASTRQTQSRAKGGHLNVS